MRTRDGAYEEDSGWAVVVVVFEAEFRQWTAKETRRKQTVDEVYGQARRTLREWHPDDYERFFGVPLTAATATWSASAPWPSGTRTIG
jgi:hypothetical protein